ncbi:hypothetical protein FH609_007640 [Streptomyces sp. 3MP-14]|uniref:Uncharacterized protein n=1 Tax=Streptomyces mimosae TaxID=2586635 RepID=A0A5N6AM90_9ACTN|nr:MULTISPECIES: hypothetical protein [Streptomyces]KAB8168728.1 hypothetical protein FH607_005725 [Streptomyces mimosae]KAB8177992.1 hypothetical protein FH609_007640 [Streptomyces sp. 3MP-14]
MSGEDARWVRAGQLALSAAGLVLLAAGVRLLWTGTDEGVPARVGGWLLGVLLAHDLLLVPLVLLVGWAVRRVPGRGALRAGLLTGGCLVLVALPPLLRRNEARYPTSLPLDYPRGLAVALGVVALLTAAGVARQRWAARGARRGRG